MSHYILAYISKASRRNTQQLRVILGETFTPAPLPYVKGPFVSSVGAERVLNQLLEIRAWGADDDVLLAGPPNAALPLVDAFELVCRHEAWTGLTSLYGYEDIESWDVALAVSERCIAISATRPEGGIGAASCFVVDRESRRVFPRFMLPLWRYIERDATVRTTVSKLRALRGSI